jgi:putative transposase
MYHVMARGNRKANIFEDDEDRRLFLDILSEAAKRYTIKTDSYCLMGNHYHVVLETPLANLSDAMHFVDGKFAQASNHRHHRTGHLFEAPYVAILIDTDDYLRTANAYVVMNPVAAGFVSHVADWTWSSYRATAGLEAAPNFLSLEWIDLIFAGISREDSHRRYREFITGPESALDPSIEERSFYGSPSFQKAVRSHIGATLYQMRLPRAYRALGRPALGKIFEGSLSKAERNSRILRAHVVHGYRLSEIAASLRLHPNTLSRIVQGIKKRCR